MKKVTSRLIEEVHARPALWQTRHPHHKIKSVVKNLWNEVQKQFPDMDVVQLKKKWKNLKDSYRKELKKNPQMHTSDPNTTYISLWQHFSELDFLKDECNVLIEQDEDKSAASDNELHENYAEYSTAILPNHSPSGSSSNQIDRPFKRNYDMSPLPDYTEPERKRPRGQASQDSEGKSDDYHFLMSILPEMRRLHPIQKIRLRNKINQALLEEMTLAMCGDPLNFESILQKTSEQN